MKPVLTPTILDAFTNLNLDQDLLSELRATVMKTLGTVQLVNLPTVVNAHKIVVIEGGKAVEQGTHDALLAAKGKYAALVAHQLQKQREQLEGTG